MTSTGTATIKAVQSALRQRHYYHEQVDGFFGQATAIAIERFQMDHDLYVKGVLKLLAAQGVISRLLDAPSVTVVTTTRN